MIGFYLIPIIRYPLNTFLIPFCNLRLQKGIRKVSEKYQKGIRWWHANTSPLRQDEEKIQDRVFVYVGSAEWNLDLNLSGGA